MGFKVGDLVRDNCDSLFCSSKGEVGVVTRLSTLDDVVYADFPSRPNLLCGSGVLELVKDSLGKLDESRLSEIIVKEEVKDSDPQRIVEAFRQTMFPGRGEGRKDDNGKPRWDLLLGTALLPAVKSVLGVLMFGAQKYADNNWLKVPNARERYYDALLRHLTDWKMGKRYDEDSGLPTLAHAACDALFLLAFDLLDGVRGEGEK